VAGNEHHAVTDELPSSGNGLIAATVIIDQDQTDRLTKHTARRVEIGNRHFGATLHLLPEPGVIAGDLRGGTDQRRSTLELILLQLRNLAAQGNIQAFRAYPNLVDRYAPQETKTQAGYLIVPEQTTTSEEWERVVAPRLEAYQRSLREKFIQ
jgi:hypothetical protein